LRTQKKIAHTHMHTHTHTHTQITDHESRRVAKIIRRGAQFGTAAVRDGVGYYLWLGAGAYGGVGPKVPLHLFEHLVKTCKKFLI